MCASVCACAPLRCATARDDRGRLGVVGQAEAGQHPLQRRGAQGCRGAVASAPGAVQPAATFDRLGCAHYNGHPLCDKRTETPAPPHRDERDRQAQLDDDPLHRRRNEVGDFRARIGFALTLLRCVPDHSWIDAGKVHGEGGIAGRQESAVRHEFAAADDCDGAPVIGVADQCAVVTAGDRKILCRLVRVARTERDLAGSLGLPQVAARLGTAEWHRPGDSDVRRQRFTRTRPRRHQEAVAGQVGEAPQHVFVEQLQRLQHGDECAWPRSTFGGGDIRCLDDVDALLAQQSNQCVRALGSRGPGIHRAAEPRRGQVGGHSGDCNDDDE